MTEKENQNQEVQETQAPEQEAVQEQESEKTTFNKNEVDQMISKALETNNQKLSKLTNKIAELEQSQMTEEQKAKALQEQQQEYVQSLERSVQESQIKAALAENGLSLDPQTFINPAVDTASIVQNINKLGQEAKDTIRQQEVAQTKQELNNSSNVSQHDSSKDMFAGMTDEQKKAWGATLGRG